MTRLAILGATGSIGRQALEVVGSHPDRLRVTALASARNASELGAIAAQTGATAMVLQERDGDDALCDLATRADVDLVLVATPGIAGLAPTLAA
ncbi:MAG: 1-deoxy-D-xylulose-5-phosphate reductoisomerase, partial [Chloroflexota bacterium]|nr:1-deoxy-D-xylulose-5-phosphate reductoisomerase [Chloroflexota bacterium]